jgi:hypothetical protein
MSAAIAGFVIGRGFGGLHELLLTLSRTLTYNFLKLEIRFV